MKKSHCALVLLLIPFYDVSASDTHRYQPNQRTAEQNRLMGAQATHWYNPPATAPRQRPKPSYRPSHRPSAPHHHIHQNNIYIDPEPVTHYQTTEQVYLPYGGIYTKTTDTVPLRRYPEQRRPYQDHRKIIQQGHYYVEQNE